MCQQVMLSNRVFNVPRHVAETFLKAGVEGVQLVCKSILANSVFCGALWKKIKNKNKQKKKQTKNNSSISICFHPAGFLGFSNNEGDLSSSLELTKQFFS